jgi:hypothetical protein
MDPETFARKRWRAAEKAVARRERIAHDLAETRQLIGTLTAALPAAERNDRLARGQAVADGHQPPPQGEKDRLEAELNLAKQRSDDLQAAAELAATEILELRQANRDTWAGSQAQAVDKARGAVLEATDKLEQQVSSLTDELALQAWLAAPVEQPLADPHGGRLTHEGTLATALTQLRAAVEGLAAGTTPQPPAKPEPDPITKRLINKARPSWGG